MTVTTTPNRRARLRSATVAEIKQTARRQLDTGGPTAISLRAVARDMGLTPAALYRYFPSLEALLEDLCADCYAELTAAVVSARSRAGTDPADQLAETCRAFRRWSIAHPAEFTLMFGSPLPGVADFDVDCSVHTAGMTFCGVLIDTFLELWRHAEPAPAPPAPAAARLAQVAGPLGDTDLPPAAVQLCLSGWIRLYGLVAMEVFGHLRWAVTDVEPLFEAELADYLRRLVGAT